MFMTLPPVPPSGGGVGNGGFSSSLPPKPHMVRSPQGMFKIPSRLSVLSGEAVGRINYFLQAIAKATGSTSILIVERSGKQFALFQNQGFLQREDYNLDTDERNEAMRRRSIDQERLIPKAAGIIEPEQLGHLYLPQLQSWQVITVPNIKRDKLTIIEQYDEDEPHRSQIREENDRGMIKAGLVSPQTQDRGSFSAALVYAASADDRVWVYSYSLAEERFSAPIWTARNVLGRVSRFYHHLIDLF